MTLQVAHSIRRVVTTRSKFDQEHTCKSPYRIRLRSKGGVLAKGQRHIDDGQGTHEKIPGEDVAGDKLG